jgi:hypothetical protein
VAPAVFAAQTGATFSTIEATLAGAPAPAASSSASGFRLIAGPTGPQIALMEPARTVVMALHKGEEAAIAIPVRGVEGDATVAVEVTMSGGEQAEVCVSLDDAKTTQTVRRDAPAVLKVSGKLAAGSKIILKGTAGAGEAGLRWRKLILNVGGVSHDVPLAAAPLDYGSGPPPVLPNPRAPIENALIEWDWRMQDGIGTARQPNSYATAVSLLLQRGDALVRDLGDSGVRLTDEAARWEELRRESEKLSATKDARDEQWEGLWLRAHALRRAIALSNPLAQTGPVAFVKQVPSIFSHQLTQYYGSCARPGGGVFVLEAPGRSTQCRQLAAGALPEGSYQHLDVSYDGKRVLFSHCRAETTPKNREQHLDRFYHLYEVQADGTGLKQLTDGAYDDLSPRYLPDGKLLFTSTRRGGFHRCGRGPCGVYTLALADADGSHPRVISYHETNEWDPAVLSDGRIVYTRWDYVDRHAIHYQQLWTVRPDGSDVRIYYGNNTFNPVGVWEARLVPGSERVMATAAAHHAMTAGSIILLDVTRGVDGLDPITRLTPDVLFPESETPVAPNWYSPVGVPKAPPVPPEAARWPGHCYRSPLPLSEKYFLGAYSFDKLIGEPTGNPANMFGLYLVDCFGNKELLYRDANICSLWPMPLRARPTPPAVPSVVEETPKREGKFFLMDVYASSPPLPKGTVKRLRIMQVLPKSTPHINDPAVGVPNASPGRQVLGTVPVEPDGSAWFTAPAGVALAFQALDEQGMAVQVMRSVTYLQAGETTACVGCHEHRATAPPHGKAAQALARAPSVIQPGPEGSRPLSYPILVQPVLDKHCVSCHKPEKADGRVILTGAPQGHYTVSYNTLAPLVPHAAWGLGGGDFRRVNSEPLSVPGHFGARGSKLMKLLLAGHEKVTLNAEEIERLATWMDANVLFYGTFDRADQARQQRGERIAGPKLE